MRSKQRFVRVRSYELKQRFSFPLKSKCISDVVFRSKHLYKISVLKTRFLKRKCGENSCFPHTPDSMPKAFNLMRLLTRRGLCPRTPTREETFLQKSFLSGLSFKKLLCAAHYVILRLKVLCRPLHLLASSL